MLCQSIAIAIIFASNTIVCHLKDLGEVTLNLSALPDIFEGRIVGGKPVDLEHYPFNTQFFNRGGLCSAIILTIKTALTAAHCFDINKNIGEMKLWAGIVLAEFTYNDVLTEVWRFIITVFYSRSLHVRPLRTTVRYLGFHNTRTLQRDNTFLQ